MNELKPAPGTQAAEASGKQVLLYEPSGLLGGTFTARAAAPSRRSPICSTTGPIATT